MIDGTSDKIFGIGLSKTGTTSLTEALRILGYKTLHNNNIILRYTAETLKLDLNIINSNDAFTDIGIVKFYKQLDINYPNSKFILTVREIDSWLKSCQAHWCKKSLKEQNNITLQLRLDVYNTLKFNRQKMRDVYKKHISEVMSYFKKREQDLLILNVCEGEGWHKLCPFLNKPIPTTPFPKTNVA